jgi:hypothetical protein
MFNLKVLIFACLCSLLIFLAIMIPSNLDHLLNVILDRPDFYTGNLGMFVSSFAGLIARLFAVVLAMAVGFIVWGMNTRPSWKVERIMEAALFLEGTYFVLLFPSGLWWLGLGFNFLGIAFLLQSAFAGSTLLVLSFKVRDFSKDVKVLKWLGIAAVGYVAALWFNSVFRWFDQIAVIGSEFLLRGATSWGFLVSLTAMSLAVVFAVPGAYFLTKNNGESARWFGVSLTMVGVYYVVYVVYSFTSSNLDSAMQIDVWTLPFLFLGLKMLRAKAPDKIM